MNFSIIMPVYNVENYVRLAIESVLGQTYKGFELIIVNDGSTDSSFSICEKYLDFPNVVLISQNNMGLSEARNTGIKKAIGNYVIFIDSDDYWNDVNFLDNVNMILKEKNYSDNLMIFNYVEHNLQTQKKKQHVFRSSISDNMVTFSALVKNNEYKSSAWTKILKRDFLLENSLFFVKNILSEDVEWSARVLIRLDENTIPVYNENVYVYNTNRSGSITNHKRNEKHICDLIWSISQCEQYLLNLNNKEKYKILLGYLSYQYAIVLGKVSSEVIDGQSKTLLLNELVKKWYMIDKSDVNLILKIRMLSKCIGKRLTIRLLGYYMRTK